MNEKYIEAYKTKINEINEKAMKAYEEKNVYKLIDLYGDIKFFKGCLMNESLEGFNAEVNNLYEESSTISRNIYYAILDIL